MLASNYYQRRATNTAQAGQSPANTRILQRGQKPMRLFFLLLPLLSLATLSACGNSHYDQSREWRLQECERVLNDEDRSQCKANTPHYQ
ncbi:hypothetical protein [Zhongshania sp.]|uniref:hypothetical protein n=1 Tax=Zhongshania sp. TaxID=1971902 RepID=UPI0035696E08